MGSSLQETDDLDAPYERIIALHTARKHVEAIPLAERYADAMKERHGADHPQYGAALNNLAQQIMAADRLADAEQPLRRALTIIEGSSGARPSEIGKALVNLADLLLRTGRSGEALPLMRRAIAIIEQRSHVGSQGVLREVAQLIDADRLGEALPLIRRLMTIVVTETEGTGVLLAAFAEAPAPPGYDRSQHAGSRLRRRLDQASQPADDEPDHAYREAARAAAKETARAEMMARAERALRQEMAGLDMDSTSIIPNRPVPTAQSALQTEAGRLAYQIPRLMWRGVREKVEVRLGRLMAPELTAGFDGRGNISVQDVPIVETMSVSLMCEPGAFDIVARSQEVQMVKPDLVKGTAFHQSDFAKWVWLVTPRQSGEHTLLVKVSAAIRDSRGLPTTSSLPDRIIAVTVRVHLGRATASAVGRAVPWLAVTVAGALVSTFTRDYWWPYVRDIVWPAVRAMAGMP